MINYQLSLKNFSIKNFRKFAALDINFANSTLAVLAGKNATGKTSILEAINIALSDRSSRSTDIVETDFNNDKPIIFDLNFDKPFFFEFPYPSGGHFGLIPCYGFVKTIDRRKIKESGKFFSSEYDVKIDYKIEDFNLSNTEFEELKKQIEDSKPSVNHHLVREFSIQADSSYAYRKMSDPVGNFTPFEGTKESFKYNTLQKILFPTVFYYDNNRTRDLLPQYNTIFSRMSSELNWRFKREFLKEENAQEKNELFQTFEDLHEKINKLDSHEKELVEPSLKRVKDVFDIDLGSDLKMFSFNAYQPYSTAWLGHLTSQNQGVPVMNFGSGISMLLAISLSLSFAEESKSPFIVLIDEPELHLHADLQKKLFSFLKESIFQTILSTHSHLLLDKQDFQNNLLLEEDGDGVVQIKNAGQMDVADLQFRLLGNSLDDLYIPQKILLVEGKHDRALFQRCLELLGYESIGIQIVDAGGKDNIPDNSEKYREVLEQLLRKDQWYSASVIKILKIVIDGDVSTTKVDSWATTFSLDRTKQIFQLDFSKKYCLENYIPASLVKKCVNSTKLKDGSLLSAKSQDEIISIIFSDDKLKDIDKNNCQQIENRISKSRLNSYTKDALTLDILNSTEGSGLKSIIDWIVQGY
jgi:predicted ATP-dependent endonuclease of OLD family